MTQLVRMIASGKYQSVRIDSPKTDRCMTEYMENRFTNFYSLSSNRASAAVTCLAEYCSNASMLTCRGSKFLIKAR